jgi:hypothetical protein
MSIVRSGADIFEIVTAKRMNAIQDSIKGLVRGDNCNTGPGIRKRIGDGWFTLSADRGSRGGAGIQNISFFLTSTGTESPEEAEDEGDPKQKVLIFDGKINGTFPDGMGGGNYELVLEDAEDSLIYAGITFKPEDLSITSRFCGVSTAEEFPISRVEKALPPEPEGPPLVRGRARMSRKAIARGILAPPPPPEPPTEEEVEFTGYAYWMLGFTYVNADGGFNLVQTMLGDINFELIYGSLNGKPALLPVYTGVPWISLDALFEEPEPEPEP